MPFSRWCFMRSRREKINNDCLINEPKHVAWIDRVDITAWIDRVGIIAWIDRVDITTRAVAHIAANEW